MRSEVHEISETGVGSASAILNRGRVAAIPLGIIGIVGLLAGFFLEPSHQSAITSYFFAYFFWMGLTLGAATLTYLHHTVRGAWGLAILRMLEASNRNLPLMAILFLPIAGAMFAHWVYPWTDAAAVAANVPMRHRAVWMNPVGFSIRAVIYFAFWIITTKILNDNAAEEDRTFDPSLGKWRQSFAPPIGVIHVVLLTFAYTDWVMSLSPNWFSTMYGGIFMIGGLLSMLALSTFLVTVLYNTQPFNQAMTPAVIKDLGNLCLGFTMFWAYTSLAQFLIQWSGNLPEEITFYADRFSGALVNVGALIVAFQFFAPFLMLLSGRTKRTVEVLRRVALLIVFMRAVDIWWQVTPFLRSGSGSKYFLAYLLDISAFVGVGGIWLYFFLSNLRRGSLLPAHDKRLQYAKAHSHA